MRSHLHRVLISTGIVAAMLLGTASSSLAQVRVIQRDRHDSGPREAPPPPREIGRASCRERVCYVV